MAYREIRQHGTAGAVASTDAVLIQQGATGTAHEFITLGSILAGGLPAIHSNVALTGTTAPTNGLFLPTVNTPAIAVNGTADAQWTASAYSPSVSDGLALGTSSLMWSDAFLASGGVINWNNGNVTLTHSSGTLTASGALSATTMQIGGVSIIEMTQFPIASSATYGTGYYFADNITPSSATVSAVAGRMYAQPFNRPGQTFDRIGVEVTAGAAGSCRLGMYADGGGAPGALIEDYGTVSTTSIAVVEYTLAAKTFPNKRVWLVALFEAAPDCRAGGATNANTIGAASTTTAPRGYIITQAYGALPGTAPAGTRTSNCPAILIRKT